MHSELYFFCIFHIVSSLFLAGETNIGMCIKKEEIMGQTKQDVKQSTNIRFDIPDNFVVIMHNDDFTTMEFVVRVLKTVFSKKDFEAEALMLTVHKQGEAVVGKYTRDMAESKCKKAILMARQEGFPFKVTCEREMTRL